MLRDEEHDRMMAEVDARGYAPARRKARWPWIALIILILLGVIYSGFWYYLAGKVTDNINNIIAKSASDGVTVNCRDFRKAGFPLRLDVSCSSLSVEGSQQAAGGSALRQDAVGALLAESGNNQNNNDGLFAFHSGFVTAGSSVLEPHWLSLEMGAPATLKLPGLIRPIEANWQSLKSEGDFTAKTPRNISVSMEKPSISDLPFFRAGEAVSANYIRFESHEQDADKADFSLAFDNLALPYSIDSKEGILPAADGAAEVSMDNGDDFYAMLPQLIHSGDAGLLRGKSGNLQKLNLAFENGGGVTLSGPFSVADNGKLNGRITIEVDDPAALVRTISSVFPDQADNLNSLAFVINAMPKGSKNNPRITLDIHDGHMRMGFLKLGKIPPL